MAHEGACAREHKNRRTLDNRIAAFERAVLAGAWDRSDLPHGGSSSRARGDALDRSTMPTAADAGASTGDELAAAGFGIVDVTPNVRALPPGALMQLVRRWEEHRATWRDLWETEGDLARQERAEDAAAAVAAFRALSDDEQAERLAARVAELQARAAG